MDRDDLHSWLRRYETVWRTEGTDLLRTLFTEDVRYRASPWQEPVRGLAELADFWDAERAGPDEEFVLSWEILAVDGDLGIVRVNVDYAVGHRWRDLWVIRFDRDGRCAEFEEWPFAPDQADAD